MFGNYRKMKDMEAVIASVVPAGSGKSGFWSFAGQKQGGEDELEVETVAGDVYPTLAEIVIDSGDGQALPDGASAAGGQSSGEGGVGEAGNQGAAAASAAGTSGSGQEQAGTSQASGGGAGAAAEASGSMHGGNAGASADAGKTASVLPVEIPADAVKHVVREGETLYGICMEEYHSMAPIAQICQWNGLADENHISVGQELYLPAK